MSKEIDNLRRRLCAQFRGNDDVIFAGVVTEVDAKACTCTLRRDDAVDYFDVRLRSVLDGDTDGYVLIPAKNSTVMVGRIAGSNELIVLMCSVVDEVRFTREKVKFHITASGFTIQRDDAGLKKTLDDLLTALQKLTVPTGVGPSGVPVNITDFQKIQQELTKYLEA